MPLAAGTKLGPYEIVAPLGAGGMGEVYRARDTKLDRDVALKLLPAHLTHDPDRLRRFEQEARSASALNHPAIVAIYDLGQDGLQPYIGMELVEGETLRHILARGAMPTRRALHVAAQIADGLAKAHDAGIVHRDLKPENLMVSSDGFAKILDFGLAKLVAGDDESQAAVLTLTEKGTKPGSVMGTVGYMSPEQASGRNADSRSDQFSFGLVLYEMLTGRRAFAQPTAVETLSAIIRDDAPPIEQVNPSVPAPVRWIVERCLGKAPADRYGSTRDLARDLASARDHLSELTSSGATATSTRAPRLKGRWRERIAWSLVAVLALATLGLMIRSIRGTPAEPGRPVRFTITTPPDVNFYSNVNSSPLALSPDGHRLVFTGVGADGRRMLWLREFDSLVSRPLAGTEGGVGPFWSPDGLAIGFFAQDRLKRMSLSGGDVTILCEARGGGGATWNRDGVILFASSIDGGLSRVAAAGGTAAPVTVLDKAHAESGHAWPVFLPDGRHFAFFIIGGDNHGTYLSTLDSPNDRTRLIAGGSTLGFSSPDYLLFARDRVLMAQRLDLNRLEVVGDPVRVAEDVDTLGPAAAFAVSPGGTLAYWSGSRPIGQPTWVQRDGTAAGTLGPRGAYVNVALSPDGRQLAVDRLDPSPAVWLIDVARGTATRATFGAKYESTPVWSPDGQSFVFASARDTPPNLYLKRLGASVEDERLFRNPIQCFPQSWSPDGRLIAYMTVDPKTDGDIWLVPAHGDRPSTPTPFLVTPFFETNARISPDGRWLAYVSNESGRQSVYVTRFPQPGGKWQVSTEGGGFPVWRRDGRELFYRASDGKLMAVPVSAGSDFEPGTPVPLFAAGPNPGGPGSGTFYDVAPDGRFLINKLLERTSPPATVVLNWTAGVAPRN